MKKMSDLMLLGILRMPVSDNPKELSATEWVQIKSAMREAATRIETDADALEAQARRVAELEYEAKLFDEALGNAHARIAELEASDDFDRGYRAGLQNGGKERGLLRARIAELERDFHKQCEFTARTMMRVADAEDEAAMLSILLERREEALMQVDKMCDASPGFIEIQKFVRAALNGEEG
jgi:hypothetical protein